MLKRLFGGIYRRIAGEFKWAKKQGMTVEDGVTVMNGTGFGSEPYLITLKKNCRISSGVLFVTHDGGTWAFRDEEKYKSVIKYGKIVVGERTFIGAGSVIMPGVTIGSKCVVGAGSIVTKDIPDNCVVAGVPAKIVCSTSEYAEKCLSQMPENFDETAYNRNKKEYLLSIM